MGSQKPISDKHLIAEQPGMTVLIVGFLIAFLIGYTTKSLLSPSRISARIEKAASHIHKDIDVKFSSARVSLSDGIMPRFSVIITDVHMESTQKCWGAPVLDVDELRLPISVINLFRGREPVRNVEADNVSLVLRDDFDKCEEQQATAATETKEQQAEEPAPLVSVSPSEQTQKYRNDVRGLSISSLKIMPEKHSQYATEFLNFTARVRSFEPRVIEIRAKTNLMRDQRVGDYLSHANLYMQYKESPAPTVQSHFYGNWREGHYSLIANYTIDDKLLAVESDLKHIPLSQILNVLQKYGWASNDLNGRQVWISSKARLLAGIEDLKKAPPRSA